MRKAARDNNAAVSENEWDSNRPDFYPTWLLADQTSSSSPLLTDGMQSIGMTNGTPFAGEVENVDIREMACRTINQCCLNGSMVPY